MPTQEFHERIDELEALGERVLRLSDALLDSAVRLAAWRYSK